MIPQQGYTATGNFNACLTDYLREVHCRCGRCDAPALIRAESPHAIPWTPTTVRFSCSRCAHRPAWPDPERESRFAEWDPASGVEPYFGYPLLVELEVGGHRLALLSPGHADDLARYLSARLRPRPANAKWAMVNRLPRWMKLARHRARLLQAIREGRGRFPA